MAALKLFLLALLLHCIPGFGLNCRHQFISLSGMTHREFEESMQPLLLDRSLNRVEWLSHENDPRLLLDRSNEQSIAGTIVCCGMTQKETVEILEGLRAQHPDGKIPLQAYLEAGFKKAAAKFGKQCGKDCMLTALTHIHHSFADLGKPAQNHEAIAHFMEPVEDRSNLQWGDVWVLRNRSNGRVIHVAVNLANGFVLTKPGMGPARVEPLTSAMEIYTADTRTEAMEIWRSKADAPEYLKETFNPQPPVRRPWWLPQLFSVE